METSEAEKIELLNVKEVAKLLQVSESKVRDIQHARLLAYIKIGGAVRFNRRDVIAYIQRQTFSATR